MPTATAHDMTVPEFAQLTKIKLDWLRKLIGKREDLQRLFRHVGPLRVLASEDIEEAKAIVKEAAAAK